MNKKKFMKWCKEVIEKHKKEIEVDSMMYELGPEALKQIRGDRPYIPQNEYFSAICAVGSPFGPTVEEWIAERDKKYKIN